jgi:hypothetical protein
VVLEKACLVETLEQLEVVKVFITILFLALTFTRGTRWLSIRTHFFQESLLAHLLDRFLEHRPEIAEFGGVKVDA